MRGESRFLGVQSKEYAVKVCDLQWCESHPANRSLDRKQPEGGEGFEESVIYPYVLRDSDLTTEIDETL